MTAEQQVAFALLLNAPSGSLFASQEALNLARTYASPDLLAFVTQRVQVFAPKRYQRRWRSRLRQQFGFGREDAHQVALASFGEDFTGARFGVDYFVTFDLRFVQHFQTHHTDIARSFQRMTCQLVMPYRDAELPQVVTPHDVLSRFERW